MSIKDDVLSRLLGAQEDLSGSALAEALGVSRSAVWKAIEQLRAEGYRIEAATNRGYRIAEGPELLTLPEIRRWTTGGAIGAEMEIYDELDSTNNRAKELALRGAPHGTAVLARRQTMGRGRFGRPFFSPEGSGVYISFVLRPQMQAERAVMITSMTAVAVAHAMERVAEVKASIKWVNDVYLGAKKACGILCEAGMDFESGNLQYVVVGVGVNVGFIDFPPELREIATSVSNACGRAVGRSRFCAELINELNALYPSLKTGAFMAESRARSNVIGREIDVLRGDERYPAFAEDIDDGGSLIVRRADGRREVLRSGEISVRFR